MANVDLSTFGAVAGDEVSSALRRAFSQLRQGDTLTISRSYRLADQVTPSCNVVGSGEGVLNVIATSQRAGILQRNGYQGQYVRNLTINCQIGDSVDFEAPIYAIDVSRYSIEGCRISGITKGHAISIKASNLNSSCNYNRIVGNTINCTPQQPGVERGSITAVEINSLLDYQSGHTNTRSQWSTLKIIPGPRTASVGNVVSGNSITGGYYGLSMVGCEGSLIENNLMSQNMRGMSLQNKCDQNTVRFNQVVDNISAGIHLAYGSSFNVVSYNSVFSSRANGEGMLQAYVRAQNNTFEGNTTYCSLGDGAKYHFYTGVDSDGNIAISNSFGGRCSRAYMACESDWLSTLNIRYHRAHNAPNDDRWASRDMSGFYAIRNTIAGRGDAKLILLSAVNNRKLENVSILEMPYEVTTIGNPSYRKR